MEKETWLPLTDYATKYRISISTLRRRIKAQTIPFRFNEGKYYISDAPPIEARSMAAFSASLIPTPEVAMPQAVEKVPLKSEALLFSDKELEIKGPEGREADSEPILSSATKLLSELKKAYMSILHEKEEQIIQLKEEASDLKTLVRALEEENERLRGIGSHHREY